MTVGEVRQMHDGDEEAGGWHFTLRNGTRIWRHTCCRECAFAETGHPTEELAVECLYEWSLDKARNFKMKTLRQTDGCVVCAAPTKMAAVWADAIPPRTASAAFCDEHATLPYVLKQVKRHGELVSP